MASGKIKWRRGDYIRLGRAISEFNKKIDKLEKEEKSLYLPSKYNYKKEKENIQTRKGYNEFIRKLARATEENLGILQELPSGEWLSKYEYSEIKRAKANYQRQLTRELNAIDRTLYPYRTSKEMDIEGKLERLKNWKYKKGDEFKDLVGGIFYKTSSDSKYRQALNYMNNYKKVMEKYEGFANYEILKEKMESITNPLDFYKYVGNNEILNDLQYQSDEQYTQERFNEFVAMWGLDIEEDVDILVIEGEEDNQGFRTLSIVDKNKFDEEGEKRRKTLTKQRLNKE